MSYMRITNSMISRKYIHHLNRNLGAKNNSEKKISSNRQYDRASQSPINAAKAMQVRKSLADDDLYTTNLKNAQNIYDSAEGAIMSISSLIHSTYEKLIYGANGTQSPDEDEIIAQTIEQYGDEMARIMNISVADRQLFGGTNNTYNPFEIKSSGKDMPKTLYYNGVEINSYEDPAMFPSSAVSYVDIGIGMYFNEEQKIHYIANPDLVAECPEYFSDKNELLISLDKFRSIIGSGEYYGDYVLSENLVSEDPDEPHDLLMVRGNGTQRTGIEDQSAFQITFNGAEILGCGIRSSVSIFEPSDFVDGEYSFDITLGGEQHTVVFTAVEDDIDTTIQNFENAVKNAFATNYITMSENGTITSTDPRNLQLTVVNTEFEKDDERNEMYEKLDIIRSTKGFSNNIIQLTLEAADTLRNGDKRGAARYADVLFASQTYLSLSIADIGNKEEFIDFNLQRMENTDYSLAERQNDLEFTNLGTEITNYKMLEAIYNASLQMGASALPMSIFNFIS